MNADMYQTDASLTAQNFNCYLTKLTNLSMGLAGESGETIDLVKKFVFHNEPIHVHHIKDELGDVLWYLSQLALAFGFSMTDLMESNLNKLKQRYPNGFEYGGGRCE